MSIKEFAEAFTQPEVLVAVFVSILMFATVLTVMMPALDGNKLNTRLKSVTDQRERLRRAHRAQLESASLRKNSGDKGAMQRLNEKFNLAKLLEDETLKQKLMMAGIRGAGAEGMFYGLRLLLPFAFGALAGVYIFLVAGDGFRIQTKVFIMMAAAAAGYYAPGMYLNNKGAKRMKGLMRAFPDALDMILICVESGMSIEMAFAKVGAEVGTASPALAEELQLTVAELSYLPERRNAYENFAERTGHEGVKSVCIALIQAERYGTPMGDALRVMAKENRELRMSEAERKAAALPAKLTVPMILFFLPVLFLVVLGPAYIKFKEMQEEG